MAKPGKKNPAGATSNSVHDSNSNNGNINGGNKKSRRRGKKKQGKSDLQSRRRDIEKKLMEAKQIMQKRQKLMEERAKAELLKEMLVKRTEALQNRQTMLHKEYNRGVRYVGRCVSRFKDAISLDVSRFQNQHVKLDHANGNSEKDDSEDFLGLGSSGSSNNSKIVLPKEYDTCACRKEYQAEFELQGVKMPIKNAVVFPVGKKRDLKRISSLRSRIKSLCEQGNSDLQSVVALCRELNLLQFETELGDVVLDNIGVQTDVIDVSFLVQDLYRAYGSKFIEPQSSKLKENLVKLTAQILDAKVCSASIGLDQSKKQQLVIACFSRSVMLSQEDTFVQCFKSLLDTAASLIKPSITEEKQTQLKILVQVVASLQLDWSAEITGKDIASDVQFAKAQKYTKGYNMDSNLEAGKVYTIPNLSNADASVIEGSPLPNIIIEGSVSCMVRNAGVERKELDLEDRKPVIQYTVEPTDTVELKLLQSKPMSMDKQVYLDTTLFTAYSVKGHVQFRVLTDNLLTSCQQLLSSKDTERVAMVKRQTRILRFRGTLTVGQQTSQNLIINVSKQLLDICNILEEAFYTEKQSTQKEIMLEDDVAVLKLTEMEKAELRERMYSDMEERRFYENLPDVLFYTGADEEEAFREPRVDRKVTDDQEMEDIITILSAYTQLSTSTKNPSNHMTNTEQNAEEEEDADNEDQEHDDLHTSADTEVDALLDSMLFVHSAASVDEVQDTILMHSTNKKSKVSKIVTLITQSKPSQATRAPYFIRAIARIQRAMPRVGEDVVEVFNKEVHESIKMGTGSLERRLKTVRFLAELVKFQISSATSLVFTCWSFLLSRPTSQNIQLLVTLLDNCGRWLYCDVGTHPTTRAFLDMSLKKIASNDISMQLVPLLKTSLDACVPMKSSKYTQSRNTVVEAYIRQLFLSVLPAAVTYIPRPDQMPVINGVKQPPQHAQENIDVNREQLDFIISRLEDLPHWDPTSTIVETSLLHTLETKHGVSVFPNKTKNEVILEIALESCTSTPLSVYALVLLFIRHGFATTDSVPMERSTAEYVDTVIGPPLSIARTRFPPLLPLLVDHQLLEIKNGLENTAAYSKQVRLAHIRLFACLICSQVLPSTVLYDVLYLMITHGHSVGKSGHHISLVDPPYDVFRVQLLMELIQHTKTLLFTPMHQPRFQVFLVFFQRYLFLKQSLPLDIEYSIKDFFELLNTYACNSINFREESGEIVIEPGSTFTLYRLHSYKECAQVIEIQLQQAKLRKKVKDNLPLWVKYIDVCNMFDLNEDDEENVDFDLLLLDQQQMVDDEDEEHNDEDSEDQCDEDGDEDEHDDINEEDEHVSSNNNNANTNSTNNTTTNTTNNNNNTTNTNIDNSFLDIDFDEDEEEEDASDEEAFDIQDDLFQNDTSNNNNTNNNTNNNSRKTSNGTYQDKLVQLTQLEEKLESEQQDHNVKKGTNYHDEEDIVFTENYNIYMNDKTEADGMEEILQTLKEQGKQERIQREKFDDKFRFQRKKRTHEISRADMELEHELETLLATDMNLNSGTSKTWSKAKVEKLNNISTYQRNNREIFDNEADLNRKTCEAENKVVFHIVGKGQKDQIDITSALSLRGDSSLAKQYLTGEKARREELTKAKELTKRLIEQEQNERPTSTIEREDRHSKVKAHIEQEFLNSPEHLKGYGGQRGSEDDLTQFTKWSALDNALKKKGGSSTSSNKKK